MKQVEIPKNILLSISDKHYPFIIKPVRSFDYVKVKKTEEEKTQTKQEFPDEWRKQLTK